MAYEFKRWDNVKNCKLTASDVGANTALLKEIVKNVIEKSNVLEPILESIYERGRVADLNIQHLGVLSQLECPTRFVDEHKWIPIEKIYEIADWYIQYNAVLDELVYFHTVVMKTIKPMENFLSRYPGPFPYYPTDDFDIFEDSPKAYRSGSTSLSSIRSPGHSRGPRLSGEALSAQQ